MTYDTPYRLERDQRGNYTVYNIVHKDGDVICSGENFIELRKLIEAANEAAAIEQGDRGR
jgi:hypothetical protein